MVLLKLGCIKWLESGGEDDCANRDIDLLVLLFVINRACFTCFRAVAAFTLGQVQASFSIDDRDLWHSLRERKIDRLVLSEQFVVLIRHFHRTFGKTDLAPDTFGLIDVTGFLVNSNREVAFLAADADQIAVRHQFDVRMSLGIDQFRRKRTHSAIHRRKCLVKLRHRPADTRS